MNGDFEFFEDVVDRPYAKRRLELIIFGTRGCRKIEMYSRIVRKRVLLWAVSVHIFSLICNSR